MEAIVMNGSPKYINIEVAENGFLVCWEEKLKGNKQMDHCDYKRRSHIFTSDQEDEAFDFFVKLKKMEMGMAKSDASSDDDY